MAERINIGFLSLFIILFSCEDKTREWDNPYDPRSNKSLWTPDSLDATQTAENIIELTWVRKGRAFDGFIIDRKLGLDEWVFKDSLFDDELTIWIDTINLKTLVNNPVEYQYRIYAYADTNISLKKVYKIKPTLPGLPGTVSIIDVNYVYDPEKRLTISWQQSFDLDFFKYTILHSKSQDDTKSVFASILDKNITTYDTSSFSVLYDSWFWIEVEDTTGQKTIGSPFNLPKDPPPIGSQLELVSFNDQSFTFSWNRSNENDLLGYSIEQISFLDSSTIYLSNIINKNTSGFTRSVEIDSEHYYRLRTNDVWGNITFSNIIPASSYQKIVKLDTIAEIKGDITIMNIGPTMPFTKKLTNTKASYPIWIQNGKKIFAFTIDNVGKVISQDGQSIKTIYGVAPKDIAFNSDESLALFVGSDNDIYLAYLNEDETTVRITKNTNNEWYSDPQFILNDTKILYSQRKHLTNNNIATINIYTMDRDGKNVEQISDADEEEKFIMPRMSPNEYKIIYLFKGKGIYELNYPNEKRGRLLSINGGESVIPETTLYFRNITWSPNGEYAVFWEKKFTSTYYLYKYNKNNSNLELFQEGARYARWNGNDEILFKYESDSGKLYRKNISADLSTPPIEVHQIRLYATAPWAQLQPRQ